ncbi:MAG: thiamine diphosphokinase [Lachnospiraceae bacterium]|nr:thiamine diphosphokinase [Lachnospiraceae bacterium]
MKRCVIVGSASIKDYARIKEYIKEDDYIVYCDGGLKHLDGLCKRPDLIVGDFDSHENPNLDVETIVLPCVKDDTDTSYALKECIKRGYEYFVFAGCVGERLDHTLGNVSFLIKTNELGLKGIMIDDYSEMCVVGEDGETISDSFSFFSLISLSDKCEGVTITDAKYPLDDAVIGSSFQYAVSNEVVKGKTSKVTVKKGNLLLIKIIDK